MAGAPGELHIDPMSQFLVKPLFTETMGLFSITNATLWMALVVGAATLLLVGGKPARDMVPTRLQSVGELIYGFVRQMVVDIAGEKAMAYFPYIFTLFIFILMANLLGMLPYAFTVTSHIAVTGVLALLVFVTVTAIGFIKHGTHFLTLFWPKEAPAPLRPILAVIEIISYFVRPVSHSIRLGANILAGHALMKVFAGFIAPLGLLGVVPMAAMVGFTGFELLVAVIQAYVFTILTCVYLNDALNLH